MASDVIDKASPGGSPIASGWKNYLLLLQENAPKPLKVPNSLGIIPSCPKQYDVEFHGLITREDANRLLIAAGEGAYLVRESARAPNAYTLCLRWDGATKNYKLYYDGSHYVGEKRFQSLEDLVADGLIHMYVEKHAADYIKRMTDDIVYEESPYSEYQRRVALERRQARRRFLARRKLLNRGSSASNLPISGADSSTFSSSRDSSSDFIQNNSGAGAHLTRVVPIEEGASDRSGSSDETRSSSLGAGTGTTGSSSGSLSQHQFGSFTAPAHVTMSGGHSGSSDHEGVGGGGAMSDGMGPASGGGDQLSQKCHKWSSHTWRAGGSWCDFCRNWMWGLIQQGFKCEDCGFAAHQRCTERVLPDCRPDLKYVKRMFAVDLTTLTMAHQCDIPPVVESCILEIERRGLQSSGIYRVPGFHEEIETLRIKFDTGAAPDLSQVENVNSVASLLKLYFRLLPVPLITYSCYHAIIHLVKSSSLVTSSPNHARSAENDHESPGQLQLIAIAKCLRERLPKSHHLTLAFLLRHLAVVAADAPANQMPCENLARIFAPSLMRNPDPVEAIAMAGHEQYLVALMIANVDNVFS